MQRQINSLSDLTTTSVVNVRDRGALSFPASSDDTAHFQAAIDEVASSGGGTVFVPQAIYVVSQLRLKSNVRLCGDGWGGYLLRKGSTNASMIVLDDENVEFVLIEDLRLVGNKANNTSGSGVELISTGGDWTHSSPYYTLRNVLVEAFDTEGFYLVDTLGSHVENCHAKNVDGRGFHVDTTDSTFVGCTSATTGKSGWYVRNGNNKFLGCKGYKAGELMASGSDEGDGFLNSHTPRNLYVGCESQENGRHGYSVIGQDSYNTVFSACLADGNAQKPLGGFGGYNLNDTTGVVIADCIADNSFNTQDYSLVITGAVITGAATTKNHIRMLSRLPLTADSFIGVGIAGNAITINGVGVQAL